MLALHSRKKTCSSPIYLGIPSLITKSTTIHIVLNSPILERLPHFTAKVTQAFGGWTGNSVQVLSPSSEPCTLD